MSGNTKTDELFNDVNISNIAQSYPISYEAFVKSFAFESTPSDSRCTFSELKQFLGNKHMKVYPHNKFFSNSKSYEINDFLPSQWTPRYPSSTTDKSSDDEYEKSYMQEYYLGEEKEKFDEFLLRLYVRKIFLLTKKGRMHHIHIRILDIPLTVYVHTGNSSGDGIYQQHKVFNINENMVVDNEKKPLVNLKKYEVHLKAYVHFKLDHNENNKDENNIEQELITKVCTMTVVVEPKISKGKTNDFLEFFSNIDESMYVDIQDNEVLSLNEITECLNDFLINTNIKDRQGNNCVLVSLYDFLISISWHRFCNPIRKGMWENGHTKDREQFEKTYLDPKRYSRTLHEHRRFISYHSNIVKLPEFMPQYTQDISSFDSKWLEFMSILFGILQDGSKSSQKQNTIKSLKTQMSKSSQSEYFYKNKSVIFLNGTESPEDQFEKNIIDLSEEGSRWFISWSILLGEMLCSLSGIY